MVRSELLISLENVLPAQRAAKDRIDLERHYGIKNEIKDLGYYLLVYRKNAQFYAAFERETSLAKKSHNYMSSPGQF